MRIRVFVVLILAMLVAASVVPVSAQEEERLHLEGNSEAEPRESKNSPIDQELLDIIRDVAAEARGSKVEFSRTTDVEIESDHQRTQIELVDERGVFNVALVELAPGVIDVQIFDEGNLTVYTVKREPSGRYTVLATPVRKLAASSTSKLKPEQISTSAVSVLHCWFSVYEPYQSTYWVVSAAYIWGCTGPAILRLQIWPERYHGGRWSSRDYLDQNTYGTWFYRNALVRCYASPVWWWRTSARGTIIGTSGSDSEHTSSWHRGLNCVDS